MKRFLTIGDIHGRNCWKKFADIDYLLKADEDVAGYAPFEPEYDYYVFVGDYTDAYNKANEEIMMNLLDIIRFKKLYPKNVILLLGNHDVNYMLTNPWTSGNGMYGCTGNRPEMRFDLYELFNKNYDLFQLAFQYDNYIWTHAGIHKGWYVRFKKQFDGLKKHWVTEDKIDGCKTIADELNLAFIHRLEALFDVGHYLGGYMDVGGPLWLDKTLGWKKPLGGYHQIVGHTPCYSVDKHTINDDTTITYVDTLHKKECYYIVNINEKRKDG